MDELELIPIQVLGLIRHTAYAALEAGGTLVEMARILDDDDFRESILSSIANPETQRFMQRLSAFRVGTRDQKVASTLHRLQRFLATPFISNIVGQTRSTINVRELMDQGKLLLVDLSGIGVSNAQFLGLLLTLLFHHVALSREDTPASQRRLHFLIMDECSWFISRTVGEMADQVRKFGLGLVLATQRLGQLKPKETREAVFGNVGNLICFQMGDRDEASFEEGMDLKMMLDQLASHLGERGGGGLGCPPPWLLAGRVWQDLGMLAADGAPHRGGYQGQGKEDLGDTDDAPKPVREYRAR